VLEHLATVDVSAIVQFLYELAQQTGITLVEW
jgi:hypothetical protein